MIATDDHVATVVVWSAERAGRRAADREIAVYRFAGDLIAEVWFFPEFDADDGFLNHVLQLRLRGQTVCAYRGVKHPSCLKTFRKTVE